MTHWTTARGLVVAAAFASIVGVLGTPRAADAAIYIWNVDASGSWTTPGNWLYAGGGAANPAGYPNAAADQAFFTGVYTAARTITIPANVTVTVGTVYFAGPVAVTVTGAATSRLAFNNGSAEAQVVTTSASTFRLTVVMLLRSSLLTTVDTGGNLHLDRLIEDGGVRSLTKRGTGRTHLNQFNSYTGATRVERGQLYATGASGGAIVGNLEIGTGAAGVSAEVHFAGGVQLQPTSIVEVRAGGRLSAETAQTLGRLRIIDGLVQMAHSDITAQELTMTGGALEILFPVRLPALVTTTSSAQGPATIRAVTGAEPFAAVNMTQATTFMVNDGANALDLEITVPMTGVGVTPLTKDGAGTLRFSGSRPNTYSGETWARAGLVQLSRAVGVVAIPGYLRVGGGGTLARVHLIAHENIADGAGMLVADGGTFAGYYPETLDSLTIAAGGTVLLENTAIFTTRVVSMTGGRISLSAAAVALVVRESLQASSSQSASAIIDGAGAIVIQGVDQPLYVDDGPQPVDLRILARLDGPPAASLTKRFAGAALLGGSSAIALRVAEGALLVTGTTGLPVTLSGGILGGTGTVGEVSAPLGRLAPGLSPGRLSTGAVTLDGAFDVELNGPAPGSGYDQLDVRGAVTLNNAQLSLTTGFTPATDASFTIIANDGTEPVIGTFGNLPEGATITAGGRTFAITYRGGDGNDVVLTHSVAMTYYLAEGATGAFFDNDVLIANPTDREAPVTLTFMKEGGETVVTNRVVPRMARLTVAVDQIPGLESTSASVQVVSDAHVPLIVERTMFWDASRYGGHTANAVAQPETRWIFAEGFQGFFDTYILIANAAATPTTATLTFLREGETPFVATVPVSGFARKTVYAGDYPELMNRAFGIVVEAAQPVIAERAMYFASQPGRLWAGGHVNTGIVSPSRSWFHAEGATGGYFNTFILLSNPQDTAATVELRFLLDTGDVITRQKTLEARQRLTVNPATEGDVRLLNAAVSTVVDADVPIVSERSMYWPGEARPFGEGHNSTGVASLATRWGLAEGRVGGPSGFDTFILLANPSAQAAEVTITFLFESGAPIVRRYTVPPTSRFNVDVKTSVPELQGGHALFGALIEVTNATPIAVERSLYWNSNGVFWAGGTNALGTPIP